MSPSLLFFLCSFSLLRCQFSHSLFLFGVCPSSPHLTSLSFPLFSVVPSPLALASFTFSLLLFFLFFDVSIKWPVGRHRVHLCASPPQLYVSVSVRARVHTEAQRVLPLHCSVVQSGRLGPACLALCRRCRSRPTMFFAQPNLPGVAHGFCQICSL